MFVVKAKKTNQVHETWKWHLKRNERTFQVAIQQWFAFTIKQIREDLKNKFQKDIVSELSDWEYLKEQGQEILKPATLKIMQNGGQGAYKLLQVKLSFSVLNPEAVKAAEKFTAKLVVQVNAETKKGIRLYIKAGIKEGQSMDKIARELRPLIGLTKTQTQSVVNFKRILQNKDKYPDLTAAQIDRKALRYAEKTHRRRSVTIARTETARAQNIGYTTGMEDLGISILEFSAKIDDVTSDECRELNGQRFSVREAKGMIPVLPNCRSAFLPVISGNVISSTDEAAKALPGHIGKLLDTFNKTTDTAVRTKIQRSLRTLGYTKGLKGKPPVIPPAVVEKPPVITPKQKPKAPAGRPAMSFDDAKEWNKKSKIKDTLYHYTSDKKVSEKIAREGFDVTKTSHKTWQGQGVYAFDAKVPGNVFGKYELPLKVNVKNPFVGTVEQVEKKLDKLMKNIKPPKVLLPDGTELNVRMWLTPADELAAKTRAWKKAGYDSIIMQESGSRNVIVIFDSNKVAMIKSGKNI